MVFFYTVTSYFLRVKLFFEKLFREGDAHPAGCATANIEVVGFIT